MAPTRAMWAELSRGSETMLVPYWAWITLLMEAGRDSVAKEVTVRSEGLDPPTGAISVSPSRAVRMATALERLGSSQFRSTIGSNDVIPGIASETVSVPALEAADAAQAKNDLVHFLLRGAFYWRFVSL